MKKQSANINKLIRQAAANGGGQAGQSLVRRLTFVGTSTTAAGTRLRTTDVTSCQEWSSASAIYSEYRVLSIKAHVVARSSQVPASPGQGSFIVTGIDRSGALAVPATAQAAFGLQNAKAHAIAQSGTIKTVTVEARAVDLEDQLFSPVTAAPANFAVQWYNATPNTADYLVEFMVEFRGLTG